MITLPKRIPQTSKISLVVFYLAIFWFVWSACSWIVAGNFKQVILAAVIFVVACVAGKIINDWRSGVYLFIIWLLFEDTVRKYMGNNMTIYFAKDALIGITYLVFIVAPRKRITFLPPVLRVAIGLFFLLGVVQIFNPNSPNLVYGLLGLKLYFYYLPLIFVGYAFLRTEYDLQRFLFVSLGAAGVIAAIGIAQAIIGLDFLNPKGGADIEELGHLSRMTPSGLTVPRPPSVFVSDGRFAQYLVLAFIVGLGTAGYLLLRTKRGRKLVFPVVALVALAAAMSGGRGCFAQVVIAALVIPVGLFWGAPRRSADTYRLFKAIRRSFIVVALGLTISTVLFPKAIAAPLAFYRETILPDSPDSETFNRAWDYPLANFLAAFSDQEWAIGHGIGTASLGVQYVSHLLGKPSPKIGVESGYGAIVVETGIIGLILWAGWTVVFFFSALRVVLSLKGKPTFPIALAILWFTFIFLFLGSWGSLVVYQNFVQNAYFWLLAGILFRLPTLPPDDSTNTQAAYARAS
jgi:hypothetical protein